jgi:hypothetical protein
MKKGCIPLHSWRLYIVVYSSSQFESYRLVDDTLIHSFHAFCVRVEFEGQRQFGAIKTEHSIDEQPTARVQRVGMG